MLYPYPEKQARHQCLWVRLFLGIRIRKEVVKLVIGSCRVDKTKTDPLRPIYQLLESVGKTIEYSDTFDTRLSVEIGVLEIAANLYEHSNSTGFEVTIDADTDGTTIVFIDYTDQTFEPSQILSSQKAEEALQLINMDKRGRGLLMVCAVSDYVTFRENSTTIFFKWRRPLKDDKRG